MLYLLYLLLWFWGFHIKNLQDFIKISRALIKDIFLAVGATAKGVEANCRHEYLQRPLGAPDRGVLHHSCNAGRKFALSQY